MLCLEQDVGACCRGWMFLPLWQKDSLIGGDSSGSSLLEDTGTFTPMIQ